MRQTGDPRERAASTVTRIATRAASVALVVYLLPMMGTLAAAAPAGPALPEVPSPKVMSASEVGRHGGTFVLTSNFEPQTFNLVVATSGVTIRTVSNAFERFAVRNRLTTKVEPNLAESWTTSGDGRSWRFRLRQGVRSVTRAEEKKIYDEIQEIVARDAVCVYLWRLQDLLVTRSNLLIPEVRTLHELYASAPRWELRV